MCLCCANNCTMMMTMMITPNNKRYTKSKFDVVLKASCIGTKKDKRKGLQMASTHKIPSLNPIIYAKPCPTAN